MGFFDKINYSMIEDCQRF